MAVENSNLMNNDITMTIVGAASAMDWWESLMFSSVRGLFSRTSMRRGDRYTFVSLEDCTNVRVLYVCILFECQFYLSISINTEFPSRFVFVTIVKN